MTVVQWLHSFVRSRQLPGERPDGRPLYRYGCSAAEFASLTEALRQGASGKPLHSLDAAFYRGFVFYSAEWWRRSYAGGHWGWEDLLEQIGIERSAFGNNAFNDFKLAPAFDYWRADLIRSESGNRLFLWTSVREGGFPIRFLADHPDDGSRISGFLRKVLEDSVRFPEQPTIEIARIHQLHLSERLRNEGTLVTAALLVEALLNARSRLQLGASAESLLADKGWSDRLPFVLDDDNVRSLVKAWVRESKEVFERAESRIVASLLLVPNGSAFRLRRELRLPSRIDIERIETLLGIQRTLLPGYFYLYLRGASGARQYLSDASLSGQFYELGRGGRHPIVLDADLLEQPCDLVAAAGGRDLQASDVTQPLCEVLSELPWIFTERPDGSWLHVGSGSRRTKASVVRLLAKSGDKMECDSLRKIEPSPLSGRALFEIQGEASVTSVGAERCRILCGAEDEDEDVEYILHGRRSQFRVGGEFAFQGHPLVYCRMKKDAGAATPVAAIWSADGWEQGTAVAQPLDANSVGAGRIRVVGSTGETVLSLRVAIVPRDASVKIIAGQDGTGFVCLKGVGHARILPDRVMTAATAQSISLTAPRTDAPVLDVEASWFPRGALVCSVPNPRLAARFVSRNGASLLSGTAVAIDRLSGSFAEVVAPQSSMGREYDVVVKPRGIERDGETNILRGWGLHRRLQHDGGVSRLDLRSIQSECALALSSVLDHEIELEIQIEPFGGSLFPKGPAARITLRVARYDGTLEPARDEGRVERNASAVGAAEIDDLSVTARPLWDLDAPAKVLPRDGANSWSVSQAGLTPGPWLVTAFEGESCRYRPLLWSVPSEGGPDEPHRTNTLRDIVCIDDPMQRRGALDDRLAELAAAPDHDDWIVVQQYIETLQTLPSNTFDVVTRLVRNPHCCILALLRNAHRPSVIIEGLERLPFSWHLVPLDMWVDAVRKYDDMKRDRIRQLEPDPQKMGALLTVVDTSWEQLRQQLSTSQRHLAAALEFALWTNRIRERFDGCADLGELCWLNLLGFAVDDIYLPEWAGLPKALARVKQSVTRLDEPQRLARSPQAYNPWLAPRVVAAAAEAGQYSDFSQEDILAIRRVRLFHPELFDLHYQSMLRRLALERTSSKAILQKRNAP